MHVMCHMRRRIHACHVSTIYFSLPINTYIMCIIRTEKNSIKIQSKSSCVYIYIYICIYSYMIYIYIYDASIHTGAGISSWRKFWKILRGKQKSHAGIHTGVVISGWRKFWIILGKKIQAMLAYTQEWVSQVGKFVEKSPPLFACLVDLFCLYSRSLLPL